MEEKFRTWATREAQEEQEFSLCVYEERQIKARWAFAMLEQREKKRGRKRQRGREKKRERKKKSERERDREMPIAPVTAGMQGLVLVPMV